MPKMPVSLPEWLALLETRHSKEIDMGLERVASVKNRLNIHYDCPVIMVAGTNGKGSTCAMLEAILLQAGYRVGLYSKPHFLDFNERARINGEMVKDELFTQTFAEVEAQRGDISLTYFEFTTLAICKLLADAKLDVVILEVGLGGRLDAVNVIDADVAIVTSVDIDHVDYLGDTREKIGFEKAGIFRAGKAAICSDPVPPQSLIRHAEAIGADLWLFGRDFNYNGDKQQWNFGG
ncbi:MAG: bifunctional folylpolyglutamate synthase/dihydrofolate synthase, partial [Burkholderiales bacterium]|nr:bifunctional folylpolyglutamate synthase/dihydrofolate synthase [Burkholderiales bacterium]